MHVGIDLGTTNSVLATFDGTTLAVVPNALGEMLTPSVVRVDARGALLVGRRAFRFLETDPANTRGEFKRLMGTEERLRFEAAGKTFLPRGALRPGPASLLADAEAALGYRPAAAVISTPALFELPQNHATMQAGKLAGLAEVALIQEPDRQRHRRRLAGGLGGVLAGLRPGRGHAGRLPPRDPRGVAAGGRPRRRQLPGRQGLRQRPDRLGGGPAGGGDRPAAAQPRQPGAPPRPGEAQGRLRAGEDRSLAPGAHVDRLRRAAARSGGGARWTPTCR